MEPPTASFSVPVYSASGLGHDLLIAHLKEKREAWGLSAHSSLNISSQYRIVMDTMVEAVSNCWAWQAHFHSLLKYIVKNGHIYSIFVKSIKTMMAIAYVSNNQDCGNYCYIDPLNVTGESEKKEPKWSSSVRPENCCGVCSLLLSRHVLQWD